MESEQHICEVEILRARKNGDLLPSWQSPEVLQKKTSCTINVLVTKLSLEVKVSTRVQFRYINFDCTHVPKCNVFTVQKCAQIWSNLTCQSSHQYKYIHVQKTSLCSAFHYTFRHTYPRQVGRLCQLLKYVYEVRIHNKSWLFHVSVDSPKFMFGDCEGDLDSSGALLSDV